MSAPSNARPESQDGSPGSADNALLQSQPTSLEHLRKFAEGGYLYAVLDGCDGPGIPEKAAELGEGRAVSLVSGTAEEQYAQMAPYLIAVDTATLDWIVQHLWKHPWGIFVLSKADIRTLREHFRRFLVVQLPDSEKWFFRYYDPRITRIYLLNCDDKELRKFFGPARAFGIPETDDMVWLLQAPPPIPGKRETDPNLSLVWQIRPEQYKAFEQHAVRSFEDGVLTHAQKMFPQQCQALGDVPARELIRYGIQRAASYNIVDGPDVCKYIDLMFSFGCDFDADPRLPWAQNILSDPAIPSAAEKAARVYDAAMQTLRQAVEAPPRNGA